MVEIMPSEGKQARSGAKLISVQLCLYPLRQASIGPAIREAVRVLRQHGVKTSVGERICRIGGADCLAKSKLGA